MHGSTYGSNGPTQLMKIISTVQFSVAFLVARLTKVQSSYCRSLPVFNLNTIADLLCSSFSMTTLSRRPDDAAFLSL